MVLFRHGWASCFIILSSQLFIHMICDATLAFLAEMHVLVLCLRSIQQSSNFLYSARCCNANTASRSAILSSSVKVGGLRQEFCCGLVHTSATAAVARSCARNVRHYARRPTHRTTCPATTCRRTVAVLQLPLSCVTL